MNYPSDWAVNRRRFLERASVMTAATLLGAHPRSAAAEPPAEITKIRLTRSPSICLAPSYLAEELLKLEGFAQVEYVNWLTASGATVLPTGQADISMVPVQETIPDIDAGRNLLLLAGVHSGCYELFGTDNVRAVRDLKGKTVAVSAMRGADHVFIASILGYVGLNPDQDVRWITTGSIPDSMRFFEEGKVDAFLGFPPQPQQMRARKIGHVILDTGADRPWSQYFCCMVAGNSDFVRRYPVATKRAVRAILKASDICAQEPARAARYLVNKGYATQYDTTLEALKSLPYNRWRDTAPEDTVRFHALRLRELGMIKSTPQKIIAEGTDWRFLNELKRELKA
jgi:NitT/TauT family transport system substrate-binding protein